MCFSVTLSAAAAAIVSAQIVYKVAVFFVADFHRHVAVAGCAFFPGNDGGVGQRMEIFHVGVNFDKMFIFLKAVNGTIGKTLGVNRDAFGGINIFDGAQTISLLSFFGAPGLAFSWQSTEFLCSDRFAESSAVLRG